MEVPRGVELLNQAVLAYRSALQVCTRDVLPQDWAAIQGSLGVALVDLGRRVEGPRAVELLQPSRPRLPLRPSGLHPRRPTPGLGHDPDLPGTRPR